MCGIVGIVGFTPVNQQIYDALTVLQHRGQDAAGIMTEHDGALFLRKDVGLVRDVFQQRHMLQLKGNIGIGHVRYPTAGCDSSDEAQPFYVNAPYGICLAHNGNLTNARRARRRADARGSPPPQHLVGFGSAAQRARERAAALRHHARLGRRHLRGGQRHVTAASSGGYAVVAMILGHGVIGFRDPHGIRPLVIGKRDTPRGREHMIASESVALDQSGFELLRDVGPGEAVYIDETGRLHTQQCAEPVRHTPCIFEYVYFARPDSIIDNISVYKARLRMGELLAEKIRRTRPEPRHRRRDPDPGHQPHQRDAGRADPRREVPRGLHQEPLHRPHLHHAGAGPAQEVGAQQAERDRPRVPRQERAAGRRLDRARHDLGADHRDRARGRREQGVFRLGRAAGALPERLRHRHAGRVRTGRGRPHRGRSGAADRRRLADLPGPRRPRARRAPPRLRRQPSSTPRASRASTSPATSRRNTSTGCSPSARTTPSRPAAPARRRPACSRPSSERTLRGLPRTDGPGSCRRCISATAARLLPRPRSPPSTRAVRATSN